MDVHSRHVLAHDHRYALAAVTAALLMAFLPGLAVAQVSVEIAPLRVDLKTRPAGSYTQPVTLTNHGKQAIRVRATVSDWCLSKDGTPQFEGDATSTSYSASGWLRLNPPEQVLQPGATGTVRFTMVAPADAKDAGYRSAILFEFAPADADVTGRSRDVMFRTRVATLIYATIGAPKPAVELIDVQPLVEGGQPARAVATLKNSGPVHVRTKGHLVVYNQAGVEVQRVTLPDVPVLPESERNVVVALTGEKQAPLAPGEYRVEFRIDVGLAQLLVGETTMTIGR
jgi:P pilus assembly chaperone PapD